MSALDVRPARAEDARRVFDWANDPVTRAASFASAAIPWEDHAGWFAASLDRADRHLWIAETDAPVAFLRLDATPGSEPDEARAATVSINVAPEARGAGLGRACLLALEQQARQLGFRTLIAWIRPDNGASVRAFTAVGYVQVGQGEQRGQPALRLERTLGASG